MAGSQDEGTVFVVDDDDAVRRSVERLIDSMGLEVHTFASAQEFLDSAQPDGPSCVVLDIRMPGLSGLDLQARMTEMKLSIPVIFMTGHGTVGVSVRAMKGGAVDFLEKPFDDQELLDAVNRAIDRDRQQRKVRQRLGMLRERYEGLTPREKEVFELVTRGLLNKQVAGELGTSEKTVKIQRGRVMQKMEADSLAELVHIAHELGIGSQSD